LGTDLETLKELLLSAYHHGGKERMIHIGGFARVAAGVGVCDQQSPRLEVCGLPFACAEQSAEW
jgi:hypothetical protein